MFERSGSFRSASRTVTFLYILIRDHVTPGVIEGVMNMLDGANESQFTNGWIAHYAADIAGRLGVGDPERPAATEMPISEDMLEQWICEAFNCQAPDHAQCKTRSQIDTIASRRLVNRAIAHALGGA